MKIFKPTTFLPLSICFLFVMPFGAFAQFDPPNPCTDPFDPCPIDSNVVVLIAFALVIAAKKAYAVRKINA